MKSRMKGDFHVRFRENVGVKFPCVTRLCWNYEGKFDLKISICFRRKFTKQLSVILRNTREFNDILIYIL